MGKKAKKKPGQDAASRCFGPAQAGGGKARQLIEAGLAHHRAGRLGQAEKFYSKALALDPASADALYLRGTVFFQTGRLEAAIDSLNAAVALAPDNPGALYTLGAALQEHGRPDEAIARYAQALRIKPDYHQTLNNWGNALQALGRLDEAVAKYGEALRIKPDFHQALNNLGNTLKDQGRLNQAIEKYAEALRIKPDYPQALNNLGGALTDQGKPDQAVAKLAEALRIQPDYYQALNNLGTALKDLGRLGEAVAKYAEALRLNPGYHPARSNLGNALLELGRTDEAVACHAEVLRGEPGSPQAHYNLGNALQEQGQPDQAAASYQKALKLKPDYADASLNLGIALTVSGRLDEARRAYEAAVALAPKRGVYYRMLAETGRVAGDSPHLRRMEELAKDLAALPEADRMELHFALGTVYGDLGRPEEAFGHLLAGNRLKRGRIAYDEAKTLALFERIRAVFTPELLAGAPENKDASRLPVFIVGMPRSGTTLVEQVLSSHPQVCGAGELTDMQRLADGLCSADGGATFPEAAAALSGEELGRLGAAYCAKLRVHAPQARRIIDKLPDNFLRLGLIRLALPGARFIHVRRDPADTCLSCFSKLFTDELAYAYDLAELGRYYRAYEALMAHWRAVLPPGAMLEVRYEDVVADLEGQARALIAHCGLDWDEACLAFHRNRRPVRTASAAQVRRPLYASSVGRWHAYGDLARPLFEALGA